MSNKEILNNQFTESLHCLFALYPSSFLDIPKHMTKYYPHGHFQFYVLRNTKKMYSIYKLPTHICRLFCS